MNLESILHGKKLLGTDVPRSELSNACYIPLSSVFTLIPSSHENSEYLENTVPNRRDEFRKDLQGDPT